MPSESPPQDELESAQKIDNSEDAETAMDIAVRRLIYGLCDEDDCGPVEASKRAVHNIEMLQAENERLRDTVSQLQAQVDMSTEERNTKEEKIRGLVEAAENRRESNQKVVMLTARDIVTAIGVSRRYAYDLIEDLPDEHEWIWSREEARESQYGHLEIDSDAQSRAIGIHFERLHRDPLLVNKFTTPPRGKSP